MGYIEVANLAYAIPGGRTLFQDVSFRIGDRQHVALVGPNGAGKTTIMRLLSGEEAAQTGTVRVDGRVGYMRQFIGAPDHPMTVRDLLISTASLEVQKADRTRADAEAAAARSNDTAVQNRYAEAVVAWSGIGGYDLEVEWDVCTIAALSLSYAAVADRSVDTLSGGEQKRLALEALFRSEADVLLLDEPDNFLDIPGKRWLEETFQRSQKTIFYISHDRALLANTSRRVVTLEARGSWTHEGSFASYQEARAARLLKIEGEQRRFRERRDQLEASLREMKRRAAMNSKFASRAKSAETKLRRYERDHTPRERPAEQDIKMDLGGGRTGKIAFRAKKLAIPGIVDPFDTEIHFGERIGVVGGNGTGKSHFLKLLGGEDIAHDGEWKLGARVEPSLFTQLHHRPDLEGKDLVDILGARGFQRGGAMSLLKRYELSQSAQTPFRLLSGGQQARFQLLIMESQSPTMLLLDEPTDNLDVASAEALEEALIHYRGTVIAVTHDRWFMLLLDRFLVFEEDGRVHEALESPYLQSA